MNADHGIRASWLASLHGRELPVDAILLEAGIDAPGSEQEAKFLVQLADRYMAYLRSKGERDRPARVARDFRGAALAHVAALRRSSTPVGEWSEQLLARGLYGAAEGRAAQRERIRSELVASASKSPDGTPIIRDVARRLGLDRHTIRRHRDNLIQEEAFLEEVSKRQALLRLLE